MPEGHIIHRVAREQSADLKGQPVRVCSAQERFAEGADRLDGQVLTRTEAWGKHLFHRYEGGDILHVHLGLIGKWFRRSPEEAMQPTTRVRIAGSDAAWDLTGPMRCALVTPEERAAVVASLGPDPLRRGADPRRMADRLARSDKPVGLLLMDQAVVAGIGNVYRSEILNIVGIDPRRSGRDVSAEEVEAIWAEAVSQLRLGAHRGRIVTMPTSELPRPLARLEPGEGRYVYKQTHCGRCGTELDVYPLGGRTTWSCPTCQPR
ncbi:MAG: Fpg/Nei family DNA glycosylase [Acidimicrobiales bacterium]|nr:Fpg/Nei family DNA glycosylase [Acidimicrobiales bacterium]